MKVISTPSVVTGAGNLPENLYVLGRVNGGVNQLLSTINGGMNVLAFASSQEAWNYIQTRSSHSDRDSLGATYEVWTMTSAEVFNYARQNGKSGVALWTGTYEDKFLKAKAVKAPKPSIPLKERLKGFGKKKPKMVTNSQPAPQPVQEVEERKVTETFTVYALSSIEAA
jgi:hypothetical protein